MQTIYYIELDVHKRTISYCVKGGSGLIHPRNMVVRIGAFFDFNQIASGGIYELRTGSNQLVLRPPSLSSGLHGLLACSYSAGPRWEKTLCPASLPHVRKLGDSVGLVIPSEV